MVGLASFGVLAEESYFPGRESQRRYCGIVVCEEPPSTLDPTPFSSRLRGEVKFDAFEELYLPDTFDYTRTRAEIVKRGPGWSYSPF